MKYYNMLIVFQLMNVDIVPQEMVQFFSRSYYLTISDYVVIVYISIFAGWILYFVCDVLISVKNHYLHNKNGIIALHKATYRACYHGNTQLVRYMLKKGADINAKNSRQENGFLLAAYNRIRKRNSKDASCIHALYHAGVDINAVNANNLNVLQIASMFGHSSLVQWLIDKKANINVEPEPFILAKSAGHTDTADLLLRLQKLAKK